MIIVLSPTKKMRSDYDIPYKGMPNLLNKTQILLSELKNKSETELKSIWNANDKIVKENMERLSSMKLDSNLTPAILAYDGIAFKYMAPQVFTQNEFDYIEKHLRILSGFYGCLKPLDGITPYRLEMQSKLSINGNKDLYAYWSDEIYKEVRDKVIINLASKEYSKSISDYLKEDDIYITVDFIENVNGKNVIKATLAKMARGAMVRYMAMHNVLEPSGMKGFNELGFVFNDSLSTDTHYVFEKK